MLVRRRAIALEIIAAVAFGTAIAAALADGLRFDVWGLSLSVRSLSRPLTLGAFVLLVRLWAPRLGAPEDLGSRADAAARVGIGALIVGSALGWIANFSPTIGGADSYGYVSAAHRLLAGELIEREPLASILPFPNAISAVCPLGYVASPTVADACAPAYPLGLPALMALATLVGGDNGPFVIIWLLAAVLVAAAYAVARWWYGDPIAALSAAALVAMHPLVFAYSIQPMSDVPAAACYVLAIALLWAQPSRMRLAAAAGVAAGIALLIRPALAPALAVLPIIPILRGGRRAWPQAVSVVLPMGCAFVLQALTQLYLYGDASASGYGGIAALFSLERLVTNTRSYGYWAIASMGVPVIGAALVGLAVSNRHVRVTIVAVTAAIAAPYLLYRTYDHWETLRFFLSALVLLMIAAGAGLLFVTRRIGGTRGGSLIALVLLAAIGWTWHTWLLTHGVFAMPGHEARHRHAAELVSRATPPDAVVLALQHSGSLRYYARRDTINWDRIPPGQLRPAVTALQRAGRRVFVMTDSDEERLQFQQLHGRIMEDEQWLPAGQRRDVQLYEAPNRTNDGSGR